MKLLQQRTTHDDVNGRPGQASDGALKLGLWVGHSRGAPFSITPTSGVVITASLPRATLVRARRFAAGRTVCGFRKF
jgi:hypothetical protein